MAQIDQLVTMTDISEKLKDLHMPEKEKPAEAPSSFVADDDIDEGRRNRFFFGFSD